MYGICVAGTQKVQYVMYIVQASQNIRQGAAKQRNTLYSSCCKKAFVLKLNSRMSRASTALRLSRAVSVAATARRCRGAHVFFSRGKQGWYVGVQSVPM
jgi:hypothetical protein